MLAELKVNGNVGVLTLNRPDARNALSIELLEALHARVDELRGMSAVTVGVLTGAGRAFCAGMDLKAVLGNETLALKLLVSLGDLTIALRALPQVLVAKVNGAAIGGGCGLTTVCDFAITHADAKLGFPEVDLGVCPAVVAPWLVRRIGAGRARSVLLRGGLLTGSQARDMGLVSDVVERSDQLEDAVDELVKRLASGGGAALRATKGLLNEIDGSLDADLVRRGAELSARVLSTPDAQQRLRAKLGA